MLIARDATFTSVVSDTALSIIISILARIVSGSASVALIAVAVQNPQRQHLRTRRADWPWTSFQV